MSYRGSRRSLLIHQNASAIQALCNDAWLKQFVTCSYQWNQIHRGYLLFWGKYQIYSVEYVEITDIFNTSDEVFLVFTEKKILFLFIFSVKRKKFNFFPSHFSIILLSSALLIKGHFNE